VQSKPKRYFSYVLASYR